MQIHEIISSLGGSVRIAAALGFPDGDVGAKRVRAWAARSSIPSEYWQDIVNHSAALEAGISLSVLAAAHARGRVAA